MSLLNDNVFEVKQKKIKKMSHDLIFDLKIQEKVRDIFYHNAGHLQSLITIGSQLSNLMINIHQIIKWHILHKAIQSNTTKKSSNE